RGIAHQLDLERRGELRGAPRDEHGALIQIGSHDGQVMVARKLRDLLHILWVGAITRGKLLGGEISPLARRWPAQRGDSFVEIGAGGARPHTNGDLDLFLWIVRANDTRARDKLATTPWERSPITR